MGTKCREIERIAKMQTDKTNRQDKQKKHCIIIVVTQKYKKFCKWKKEYSLFYSGNQQTVTVKGNNADNKI